MRILTSSLVCLLFCFSLSSLGDGIGNDWAFHGWPGYKPDPVRTEVSGPTGAKATRLENIQGKDGACLVSPKAYPAKSGNTVFVTFAVRGEGRGTVNLHRYAAKGMWNAACGECAFKLKPEWRTYRQRFVLQDGPQGAVETFRVVFGAQRNTKSVEFADVRVEIRKTAFARDERPFDPVKEGWPLVWSDEFDGTAVDWSKWFTFPPSQPKDHASLDGEGHLRIRADRPDGKKVVTTGLWSVPEFKYGYYEARVKFTRQPGWWAAFWMYGMSNTNPMMDGFEIDIFEDYFTRMRNREGRNKQSLDHNLHLIADGVLRSWNYVSAYPGPFDGWHVLGCKRLPLEITYYLDGVPIRSSAAHSTRGNVAFDGDEHGVGVVPLHVIVSGQVMSNPSKFGPIDEAVFPEDYEVDYVRCYEYPVKGDRLPQVQWAESDGAVVAPTGSVLRFAVDARPSPVSRKPITCVRLFDDGYLIAEKSKPPYVFEIPFTESFYAGTAWGEQGRTGGCMRFGGGAHAFAAFATDAAGETSHTPVRLKIPGFGASVARGGRPHAVPGRIDPLAYDEGGRNVAYYDTDAKPGSNRPSTVSGVTSGEWLNYTVDIAEAGEYAASLRVGTPIPCRHRAIVLLDGVRIGMFSFGRHASDLWNCDSTAEIASLDLPAGRHVLTLLLSGRFDFSTLELKRK